jgi:hypothetical protein
MIRRTLVTAALAVGLVVSGGAAASAHECYVANRSDKGNEGASHSANWYTLEVTELYASAHFFVPGVDDPLTEAEIAEAVALTEAAGIPTSFALFERFTIPRTPAEAEHLASHTTDGKGIDHFFTKYGDALMGIAVTVSAG